jgi:hypothetical protein
MDPRSLLAIEHAKYFVHEAEGIPMTLFDEFQLAMPTSLMQQSGKAFYSGREAFSSAAPLYVLGLNPGGEPDSLRTETVGAHTEWVSGAAPTNWSAYRDESWEGKLAGCHGMQPRVLHLFTVLGLDPGAVPASNLIFARSRREANMAGRTSTLSELCWPFHSLVIERLRPTVLLCLGKTTGDFVRAKTGAHQHCGTYTEQNRRKWQSHSYRSSSGLNVVVATHPSIADWTAVDSDPTGLVKALLSKG